MQLQICVIFEPSILNKDILTDSQAAIQDNRITSTLVFDCLDIFKTLVLRFWLKLLWVPGHQGLEGNETADTLDRNGAYRFFCGPAPFCGILMTSVKTAIIVWFMDQSSVYWDRQQQAIYTMHSGWSLNELKFYNTRRWEKKIAITIISAKS